MERTARVDVKPTFAISADRDSRLFSLPENRLKPRVYPFTLDPTPVLYTAVRSTLSRSFLQITLNDRSGSGSRLSDKASFASRRTSMLRFQRDLQNGSAHRLRAFDDIR